MRPSHITEVGQYGVMVRILALGQNRLLLIDGLDAQITLGVCSRSVEIVERRPPAGVLVVEIGLRKPFVRAFIRDALLCHLEALTALGEFQLEAQVLGALWILQNGLNGRCGHLRLPTPNPVAHRVATPGNGSSKVPWSCLEKRNALQQIGLPGAVSPNQDIQRSKMQVDALRPERKQPSGVQSGESALRSVHRVAGTVAVPGKLHSEDASIPRRIATDS